MHDASNLHSSVFNFLGFYPFKIPSTTNDIKNGINFSSINLKVGITLIVYGLFKKIVIADNIANQVNNIFIPEADLGNFFIVFYGYIFFFM